MFLSRAHLTLIVSLVSIFLLSSCNNLFDASGVLPEDATLESERTVKVLLSKDSDAIDNLVIPEFKQIENYEELLIKVTDMLPNPEEAEPKLIFAQNRKNEDQSNPFPIYYSVYELKNGDKFDLLELATQRDQLCCPLRHLKVTSYDVSPSQNNNFNLSSKSPKHFAFFIILLLCVSTIILTLVAVVRDTQQKNKVLWFIFILFGFWGVSMNWTTGQIGNNFFTFTKESGAFNLKILDFTLLGASFTRTSIFQPWIMEIGIPIGAIVYWVKRKRRNKEFNSNNA